VTTNLEPEVASSLELKAAPSHVLLAATSFAEVAEMSPNCVAMMQRTRREAAERPAMLVPCGSTVRPSSPIVPTWTAVENMALDGKMSSSDFVDLLLHDGHVPCLLRIYVRPWADVPTSTFLLP